VFLASTKAHWVIPVGVRLPRLCYGASGWLTAVDLTLFLPLTIAQSVPRPDELRFFIGGALVDDETTHVLRKLPPQAIIDLAPPVPR